MRALIYILCLFTSSLPAQENISDFMQQQRLFISFHGNSAADVISRESVIYSRNYCSEKTEQLKIYKDSAVAHSGNEVKIWRHSVGSSLFMLGNFAPGEPPNFFQLSYSYEITQKDILYLEAITWTYSEPLGTYGSSQRSYPGKVKAYGVGAGYQRFITGGWFAAVSATPFFQQFFDENNGKIQSGFQLYLQFIAGYRFGFFEERLFIEPACALKYWPVNTNFPESFKQVETGAPNHIFEPSMNFGVRF